MRQKTIAIVQGRMGSTRFPGKTLEKLGKWSVIELVLKRAAQSKRVSDVVLASSTNPIDDQLEKHITELGFQVFRGSESDVLSRFYEAASKLNPTTLVRLTGDCPLISPDLMDTAVQQFAERDVDYLALVVGKEKELAFPRGFDVEVFGYESLREAASKATESYEREHVTPYIYTRKDRFDIDYIAPSREQSRPNYRVCVDTPKDLEVVRRIYDYFGDDLMDTGFEEIIHFLDNHPEIAKINSKVQQKHFTESNHR